jgi:hypothetical protein
MLHGRVGGVRPAHPASAASAEIEGAELSTASGHMCPGAAASGPGYPNPSAQKASS